MNLPSKKLLVIGLALILILVLALIVPLFLIHKEKPEDDFNLSGRKKLTSINSVMILTKIDVSNLIKKATTKETKKTKRSIDYEALKNEVQILQKSLNDLERSLPAKNFKSTVNVCKKIYSSIVEVLVKVRENGFNIEKESYKEISEKEEKVIECQQNLEEIKTITSDDVEDAKELVTSVEAVISASDEIIKESPIKKEKPPAVVVKPETKTTIVEKKPTTEKPETKTTVVEEKSTTKPTVVEEKPTTITTLVKEKPTTKTTVVKEKPTTKTTVVEELPTTKTTVEEEKPTTKTPEIKTTVVEGKPTTKTPEIKTTVVEEKPTTKTPETKTTVVEENPTTKIPETRIVTDIPALIVKEKPTTKKPETKTTVVQEKPTTKKPETKTTVVEEKPTTKPTVVEEKPTTKTIVVKENPTTKEPETNRYIEAEERKLSKLLYELSRSNEEEKRDKGTPSVAGHSSNF